MILQFQVISHQKELEVKSGNNLTINAVASLTTTEEFKNWGNLIIESSSSDSGSIIAESQAGWWI